MSTSNNSLSRPLPSLSESLPLLDESIPVAFSVSTPTIEQHTSNYLPQSELSIFANNENHTSESQPNQIDNLTNITQLENQTQTNHQHISSENIQHSSSSTPPVDIEGDSSSSLPVDIGEDSSSTTPPVDIEGDLVLLNQLRTKYTNNPSIGYLNINSLRGQKFSQLEEICKLSKIDILCIDETKLTSEIPTSRIHIEGYQYPPIRRDRIQKSNNSYGGGKVVYIRDGFICKKIEQYETPNSETIAIELSLRNKKWFIMFGYRPESINRDLFFEEINMSLSKAINKYQNILFIGDLNIDLSIPNHDKKHFLQDLCDVFDLTNMVKDKTCYMSTEGSSIDIMLTNKLRSFYKTTTIETGLSDHHKMVITFLRSHHSLKQKPTNIIYRDTKNINMDNFKNDISNLPLDELHRFSDSYTGYVTLFKSVVDRHAPMKKKTIRGNNKPFMNLELSKATKTKSRIRNKYNKWRSRENYLEWQNIKKKCKYLAKKAEK